MMKLQEKSKRALKKALIDTKILKFANVFSSQGVVILRYHSVVDRPKQFENSIGSGIIHSASVFKDQMKLIATQFNPVTLEDILLFLSGEKKMPKRPVVVTFDDGFADNYEIAAPILELFGIRAAFYVTVEHIETTCSPWFVRLRYAFATTSRTKWVDVFNGREMKIVSSEQRNDAFLQACQTCASLVSDAQNDVVESIESSLDVAAFAPEKSLMMTWDQIRKLYHSGHIIGSHTLMHPNLAYVTDDDLLYQELLMSKLRLEQELQTPVIHFSYPSPILQPHWTDHTVAIAKRAGYQTSVTCTPGKVRFGDDPMSLKRIWVPSQRGEFLWNIECTQLGRQM